MMSDATIDPREVDFYKGLAAFWWDDAGPFWPLHRLNLLRVQWISDALTAHFQLDPKAAEPLSGLRILDIGCGGGILAESMARLGAAVTGIDVVEKNIRIADLHASQQGLRIDYRACTAEAMARQGSTYDVVLNMEVVEHVADLPAFMVDCNRLVAEGGVAFVATINRTLKSWLFAKIGAEYVLKWLPKGTHRWREFRSPETVTTLLRHGGLEVRRRSGVAVNPFNRSFRLTRNMSVNYMLMARRPPATSPRGRASGQAA
jgi:2-polyprenyl-6-hydroxyphenyl methylase/3-demethylubiquinone-9 3-methyltransferase